MKKIIFVFLLGLASATAQTFTTNLQLQLPAHASPNWDTAINSNFSKIDITVGSLQALFQGTWINSTSYNKGVFVNETGNLYMSLLNSNFNNDPATSPLAWRFMVNAGTGSVASFSAGNLSPIFTTSVATATTTPALTFTLSNTPTGTGGLVLQASPSISTPNISVGLLVNSVAPSRSYLIGNGTNYVPATPASTDLSDIATLVTLTGTQSLTNKTFDAEATGNILTIPEKIWLPAAGCNGTFPSPFWDLPTSSPSVAACVTGTNTQKGTLDYATSGLSSQTTLIYPTDASGNLDARIIWTSTSTTGSVIWALSTVCTGVLGTATDDPAFNTASTVTTAPPGVANEPQTSAITTVNVSSCVAGNLLHIKVTRNSDTLGATARLIGVELTMRRSM